MARGVSSSTAKAIKKYGPSVNRLARKKYDIGGKKLLTKLVVGESADDMDAVSSAGARGKGQFMPQTRAAMMKQFGIDPWRSTDEAVHGAVLHLKGKLGHRKGLEGYNPGDPNYPQYILSQDVKVPKGRGVPPPTLESVGAPSKRSSTSTTTTSVTQDIDAAIMDTLGRRRRGSLFDAITHKLDSGAYDSTVTKTTKTRDNSLKLRANPTQVSGHGSPREGSYTVRPGANRPGVDLDDDVRRFLRRLAGRAGEFEVGTGSQHSKMTSSGNVSDHWDGHGADIPAEGAQLTRLFKKALIQAGMDRKAAAAAARKGGIYNLTKNGKRYQIIGNTNEGGNHYNHLHIGIR